MRYEKITFITERKIKTLSTYSLNNSRFATKLVVYPRNENAMKYGLYLVRCAAIFLIVEQ